MVESSWFHYLPLECRNSKASIQMQIKCHQTILFSQLYWQRILTRDEIEVLGTSLDQNPICFLLWKAGPGQSRKSTPDGMPTWTWSPPGHGPTRRHRASIKMSEDVVHCSAIHKIYIYIIPLLKRTLSIGNKTLNMKSLIWYYILWKNRQSKPFMFP